MGKTEYLPLIQVASYLAYGQKEYDDWIKSGRSPTPMPFFSWFFYANKDAPPQEMEEIQLADGTKHWCLKQPCPKEAYKDKQRDKIRCHLTDIIKYCINNEEGILKGKDSDNGDYSSIPNDYLRSINDGLSVSGDINIQHRRGLLFGSNGFSKNIPSGRSTRQPTQFYDVLADWRIIKENLVETRYKSKSEVQEICIDIMDELIEKRGELKSGTLEWNNNTDLYAATLKLYAAQYPHKDEPSVSAMKDYNKERKKRRANHLS